MDDNLLYETLAAECNRLHGLISARLWPNGVSAGAEPDPRWVKEYLKVSDEFDDTPYDDRAAQIARIREWRERAKAMTAEGGAD